MMSCAAFCTFFLTFTQYWLKWWTEAEPGQTWFFMAGYLWIAMIAWVTTNGLMW